VCSALLCKSMGAGCCCSPAMMHVSLMSSNDLREGEGRTEGPTSLKKRFTHTHTHAHARTRACARAHTHSRTHAHARTRAHARTYAYRHAAVSGPNESRHFRNASYRRYVGQMSRRPNESRHVRNASSLKHVGRITSHQKGGISHICYGCLC